MSLICLRACWSMGPVNDQYIHYGKYGDQFIRQNVSGISSLAKECAISPCYSEFQNPLPEKKERIEKEIEENMVVKNHEELTLFVLL